MHPWFGPSFCAASLVFALVLQAPPAAPATPPAHPVEPPPTKAETDRMSLIMHLPPANAAGFIGDPYPLDVDIVSGKPLGDHPTVLVLKDQRDALQEGRQLKFAGEDSKERFLSNPREYLTKLDNAIIDAQSKSYPLDRDVVEIDRMLTERFEFVYGNRCYVVGRAKNIDNFVKQAGRYVKSFDKLIMSRDRAKYPLDTSVVSGAKLPEKPYDLVVASRLVRLVDEAEAKTLLEDPRPYLAKLPAPTAKRDEAAKPG